MQLTRTQATFAELCKKAYFDRVNLCAQGFHAVPWTGGFDWYTFYCRTLFTHILFPIDPRPSLGRLRQPMFPPTT